VLVALGEHPPLEPQEHAEYHSLQHINECTALNSHLSQSFSELDWALRSLGEPFSPEPAVHFDGVSDVVACRDVSNLALSTFTIERTG
jgi:hypothetical protein